MAKHKHSKDGPESSRGGPSESLPRIESTSPRTGRLQRTARMLFCACRDLVRADSGYIALADRGGKVVEPLFIDPGEWFCAVAARLPMLLHGMAEAACRAGRPLCTNDFIHSEFARFLPEGHIPVGNILCAPFSVGGATTGLLAFANKAGGFTENDTETVSTFCELAACVLPDCLDEEGAEGETGGSEVRGEHPTAVPADGNSRLTEELARCRYREAGLLESREKLRLLAVQLQEARERERQWLSFELHEGVAQAIVVLKMELNSLKSRLCKAGGDLDVGCDRMLQHLDGVIRNVRRLYSCLSPSAVEDLGFPAALRALMREFGESTGIHCTAVVFEGLQGLWPLPVQVGMYRILQDALAGFSRVADVASIVLSTEKAGNFVTFVLESKGGLFNLDENSRVPAVDTGIGAAAMEERMKLMGGCMVAERRRGTGTRVNFTVPVKLAPCEVWEPAKRRGETAALTETPQPGVHPGA